MATRLLDAILRWRHSNPSPADSRIIYDNPDTPEAYLIEAGIADMYDFSAATARATKSPALLGEIINFALHGSFFNFEETSAYMLTLMGEPALGGEHLLAITRAMCGRARHSDGLMLTICAHPAADVSVLTAALWNAGRGTAALVAAHTGSLLPAAVGWFRTHQVGHPGYGYPTADECHQIGELVASWTTWCAGDGARTAFLAHHWSDFTTDDELFAVGAALAAAPASS